MAKQKLKPIALPAIPSQPRSQIAQVLKFALQDIDMILAWLDRKEHYRDFLDEIDATQKTMADLQARLEKRFKVQAKEPQPPEDEQTGEPEPSEDGEVLQTMSA
jgi:hypothetical protein